MHALIEFILLFSRRSASSSCFILFRKYTVIFTNASLVLLCSSSSPSNTSSQQVWLPKYSGFSGLRTFWIIFSSFFIKVLMLSSSTWNRIPHKWHNQIEVMETWSQTSKIRLSLQVHMDRMYVKAAEHVQTINMESCCDWFSGANGPPGGSRLCWSTLRRNHNHHHCKGLLTCWSTDGQLCRFIYSEDQSVAQAKLQDHGW